MELGALKWNQFAKEIRRNYEEQNCVKKTAYGEFCFFIDSYLLLYKKHQDLLRFNASFDQFVLHEHASPEALTEYYNSVTQSPICFMRHGRKRRQIILSARIFRSSSCL